MAPTAEIQREVEDSGVVHFLSDADQMGFSIPSDRPELRDPRRAIAAYDPHEFPPVEKLHMYALAQHYGIPTRLLDWTTRPLVAAYFAVKEVAKTLASGSGGSAPSCAVWALSRPFVEHITTKAAFDPGILVVTAPKATNPNLAAQGGVFTVVQPRSGDPHPLPDLDQVLLANVAQIPAAWQARMPLAYKFTLPASESRRVLRMLSFEGIHGGAVFPGLGGVVEAIRERHLFALTHADLLKGVKLS
jgi:FRG domain